MSILSLKRGLSTALADEPVEDGALLFAPDTKDLSFDVDDTRYTLDYSSKQDASDTMTSSDMQDIFDVLPSSVGMNNSLVGLTDVSINNVSNNQVLKYDSSTSKWVNDTGGGGGASDLNDLTDVDITSVADGDALVYDSSSSKWVNGTVTSGTTDYTNLTNKPSIGGVTLSGALSLSDIGAASSSDIPNDLADLSDDTTHRLVTDTEKTTWNDKQNALTEGDGIDISQENEISVKPMESGDMDEIITPLPSTRKGYHKYSTDEQVIGEWIDGKPLYQKTLQGITSANALTTTVNLSGLSYDYITISNGSLKRNNGAFVPVQTNNNEVSFTAIVLATQNLYLKVSDDANNKDADYYVTLQYTKTTD